MPRSTKAVVALHLTKTVGSSFTDICLMIKRNILINILFSTMSSSSIAWFISAWFISAWLHADELCTCVWQDFTGNHHFTPFHWLHTHTRNHFLPMPKACWHKSTTLMRLFTKSRFMKEGHNDIAVEVALLNFIHPSPYSHLLISFLVLLSIYLHADNLPRFLPLALSAGSPFNECRRIIWTTSCANLTMLALVY